MSTTSDSGRPPIRLSTIRKHPTPREDCGHMPPKEPDKVQREIEELLDRLDNFVPEERLISKIKKRRTTAAGPNVLQRMWARVSRRVSRITLGHVMLLGLALLLLASFAPGLFYGYARYAMILGLILTGGAFVLSVLGWDSRRTISGGHPEKRWRGQVMDYSEPSAASRVRDWLRGRRRK